MYVGSVGCEIICWLLLFWYHWWMLSWIVKRLVGYQALLVILNSLSLFCWWILFFSCPRFVVLSQAGSSSSSFLLQNEGGLHGVFGSRGAGAPLDPLLLPPLGIHFVIRNRQNYSDIHLQNKYLWIPVFFLAKENNSIFRFGKEAPRISDWFIVGKEDRHSSGMTGYPCPTPP